MEQKIEQISQQLDEHSHLFGEHDERINCLDRRHSRLAVVVYGDDQQDFHGLIERQAVTEAAVQEFTNWRKSMEIRWQTTLTLIRIGLIVMGATGIGVWLPILKQVLDQIP